MQGFIRENDLWRLLVTHKNNQTMLPEYLPPEGKPGFTGPPEHVELLGFKRDFDRVILEPLFKKFPFGGDRLEIAEYLDQLSAGMRSYSAENYLYATLHELIPMIAPDYVPSKKDTAVAVDASLPANAQQPATPALAALRAKYGDIDAQEVLADVEKSLPPQATVLMAYQTLNALVKSYGDEGEDYKAETAAMLKTRIGTAGRTHVAKPPAP